MFIRKRYSSFRKSFNSEAIVFNIDLVRSYVKEC